MRAPRDRQTVLLTAFEPSGDDLGSAVAAALRARRPDVRVCALGGEKMAAAGAEMIETTGEDAIVGLPGVAKVREHLEINERVAGWLERNRVDVHAPVDSPAANFPICALTKAHGAKVAHVAAPQMWAWGAWRVRKLRRLTDVVLCLLPFEPAWFRARGVPAAFIGHPMFDAPIDEASLRARAGAIGGGDPRIALLPGSRRKEFERVFPLQLAAFRALVAERPGTRGVVAAVSSRAEATMRTVASRLGGWPDELGVVVGDVDAAIAWSGLALACSGTVSLRVTRHRTPMVVMYRVGPIGYRLIGRFLLATPSRALPNLVAGRRIVPEFIPHLGGPGPVIEAARAMLEPERAARARGDLDAVARLFEGHDAAGEAASAIDRLLRGERASSVGPEGLEPSLPSRGSGF